MAEWTVVCKIQGEALCIVDAETQEDAIRVAKDSGDWVCSEWECNWSNYNGSIEAYKEGN